MKTVILSCYLFFSLSIYSQQWYQSEKITPEYKYSNFYEKFGSSISLDRDVLVVGSQGFDNNKGKVSVYKVDKDTLLKVATLKANDGMENNFFGCSVDISGDFIVVSAYDGNSDTNKKSFVYVFEKPVNGWNDCDAVAKLSTTYSDDYIYKCIVKISNDNIVLGTYGRQDNLCVFEKPDNGWKDTTETCKLLLLDNSYDFAESIDIDNGTIVVGGKGSSINNEIAFVYKRPLSGWKDINPSAVLSISEDTYTRWRSVSILGDYIFVGTYDLDIDTVIDCGAVYIYKEPLSGWKDTTESVKLLPENLIAYNKFGKYIDVSQNYIVISSQERQDKSSNYYNKYSYIYEKIGDDWSDYKQIAKLSFSDDLKKSYGASLGGITISDSVIIISTPEDGELGSSSGAAYFYHKPKDGWNDSDETEKLHPTPSYYNNFEKGFGQSIAIDGNTAVISSQGVNNYTGIVHVYEYENNKWQKVATLKASDGKEGDYFGYSVDIQKDVIIVGSAFNNGNYYCSGAAYIFEKPNTGWVDTIETAKLIASDGGICDLFGQSVKIYNDQIVIGARGSMDRKGAVYVYERPENGWISSVENAKLTTSDDLSTDFGRSISINDSIIVVGGSTGSGGAVYIFDKPNNGWQDSNEKYTITPSEGDYIGKSVCLDKNYLIIGATNKVLSYKIPQDGWENLLDPVILTPSDTTRSYGYPVVINNNTIVVGAMGDDDNGNSSGAVYIYEKDDLEWKDTIETIKVKAFDGEIKDWFGYSLDVFNNKLLISAYRNNYSDKNDNVNGAVYFFQKDTNVIVITYQPQNIENICLESSVNYKVVCENVDHYQWQVSSDSGENFYNLLDIFPFSGTQTDSLQVEYCDSSMDGYLFRCLLSNGSYKDTSEAAILLFDIESPVLETQNIAVSLNNGFVKISANDVISLLNDNCGITDTLLSEDYFTDDNVGENEILVTAIDEVGNKTVKQAIVNVSLATNIYNNKLGNKNISIIPIPVKNNFILNYNDIEIESLEVFNLSGIKILTLPYVNDKIDISALRSGIYILRVKTKKEFYNLKFIKQ